MVSLFLSIIFFHFLLYMFSTCSLCFINNVYKTIVLFLFAGKNAFPSAYGKLSYLD